MRIESNRTETKRIEMIRNESKMWENIMKNFKKMNKKAKIRFCSKFFELQVRI